MSGRGRAARTGLKNDGTPNRRTTKGRAMSSCSSYYSTTSSRSSGSAADTGLKGDGTPDMRTKKGRAMAAAIERLGDRCSEMQISDIPQLDRSFYRNLRHENSYAREYLYDRLLNVLEGQGGAIELLAQHERIQSEKESLSRSKYVQERGGNIQTVVEPTSIESRYGLEIGYPSWPEMEKLEYGCLRTILGTCPTVSRAKMMKFLGWIPTREFWGFSVLKFALRLIRSPHLCVKVFATRVLSRKVIVSQWLVAVRKAAVFLDCRELWEEIENSFSVRIGEEGGNKDQAVQAVKALEKKLKELKDGHVKDFSLKYGNIHSIFSFFFFSRRFNPPGQDHCNGVPDCYLCGATEGDNPWHMVYHCTDEFVRKVIEDGRRQSGLELEDIQRLFLFGDDWRVADNGKPIGRELSSLLSYIHCRLYRRRKSFRDERL